MVVKPSFDPGVQSYNTTVEIESPFSISARTVQPKGRVGIKAPPGSGLPPDQDGCGKAAQRQTVWDLPGFSAVGVFKFTTRFIFRFGGISYQDEVVWGRVFADRRREGEYPFDKVPVLYINGRAELCTINPMINCYTGPEFEQVKRWYFGSLPQHLMNLEAQLEAATRSGGNFYGGSTPSHGDFNVYHHLANARLVEPQCIPDTYQLVQWMELMESLPAMKAYLEELPNRAPWLLDKANRLLRQRDPEGRALLASRSERSVTTGNDTINIPVKMHDNDHLEVGEPPQWSRSVSIQMESADGEKTMTYTVEIKQQVSKYSYLLNLSLDNSSCYEMPVFKKNVTEYKCVFWWEKFPKSHLSLTYQTQKKRVWESEKVWTREFLYGEYHTIPFQVLSADKFSHTTYHVYLERDAPWWMKAATTRLISSWATILATSMAVFSASNFVALTRQARTELTRSDSDPNLLDPWMARQQSAIIRISPSITSVSVLRHQDVKELRDKMIQNIKDAFSVGDMKKSGTLVLQYCYALRVEGRLGGNGILYSHPDGTKLLMDSLRSISKSSMFKATSTADEEEKEEERRLDAPMLRPKNGLSDGRRSRAGSRRRRRTL
eukprot:g27680.t1